MSVEWRERVVEDVRLFWGGLWSQIGFSTVVAASKSTFICSFFGTCA